MEKLDLYIPWWRQMDPQRQAVFVTLVGKMGIERFLSMDRMLSAASVGAYDIAGMYLKDSGWYYEQDGTTQDLSKMLAEGASQCQRKSNAA